MKIFDLVLSIVVLAAAQTPARNAAAAKPTSALLDRITCSATLRRAGSTRSEPITQRSHGATYLSAGDEVRCNSATGDLGLVLASGPKVLTIKDGSYKVSAESAVRSATPASRSVDRAAMDPETAKAQHELAALVAKTLRYHGERGATRGSTSAQTVIYPSASGLAWPAGFVIRWDPELVSPRIGVSVWRMGAPQALWSETGVDGRRGALESAAARQALVSAAAANPSAQQVYILQLNDKTTTAIPFRVLPPEDARALEGELSLWGKEQSELLRLVGRAYSFHVRQLFWEAAQEYKAAFDLTGSCDMLNEAIAAAGRAGDDGTVRQLTERRSKFSGGCADRHR